MAKAKTKAAKKKAPAAKAKAKPKKTAAPKQAGRTRADKKTLVWEPARSRADKPTIPIVDPVAKKARSDRTTVLEKVPARNGANADVDGPDLAERSGGVNNLGWMPAGKGYHLTLDGGKLVARNDKGKRLASVPKELKDGDVADQLEGLRDWLAEHDRECVATVEQWMLRSLPVPRAVLQAVWPDPAWRKPLENAVVVAVDDDGGHDHARAGLFRGVDPKKGVGVVDLDGETAWLAADRVAIPHPILLHDLDAWRELVTQLGVTQGIAQLHRETHVRPAGTTATEIDQFVGGKFNTLMQAVGKARSLGYKMRGGFATCVAWDGGTVSEARYWVGADDPESETYTGSLLWVDGRERGLPVASVGPVAFSEGMRMASALFAARVVEKQAES